MNEKTLRVCTATLASLLLIFLLISRPVFAGDGMKIMILPFDVHSKTNKAYLKEAIQKGIASELQKSKRIQLIDENILAGKIEDRKVDEKLALTLGKALDARYAIMGSLSELGEQISVDAKIVDIEQGRTLPAVFAQGRGLESISSIAVQLTRDIFLKTSLEQRILKIEFTGNRKIDSSAINQVLKSTTGNLFSESDISEDIKAIYRMGFFDDVAADVKDTAEGKTITFIVTEKPLITEIRIKGNKALSNGDIEGVMTCKTRQVLNPEKIMADVERIKALYDSKGYYNAEVGHAIEKGGEKDIRVIFSIKENDKLYVRNIGFEGNQAFTSKELKNMMKTEERGLLFFITDSGLLKKDELKQDVGKLSTFYLNNGFINAQIGEPEITHDSKGIYIKIPIVEGKQFKVGKVEIVGDGVGTPMASLMKNLKINKKEFYERAAIVQDITYLTQVCNDEGYAYADIGLRTVPSDKEQTVDVVYNISKGHLVYFNRINITGNYKTRDKVIRRQLAFVEGDLYSSTKLKKSYMELNRLRYFEEINFQAEKGPDETLTDVNIQIKEKPTGLFSIGAGYSALDRAVLVAQVSQQNLFGRGQTLSLRAHIGSKTTNYELSFVEPWLFDIPLWSKLDVWNSSREYDTYNLDSIGFGATLGYPIWEFITGYVGYRISRDDVQDIQTGASYYVKQQEGETTTSSVTLTLVRDTTDDVMFPSRGSKNSASMQYAGKFLGGNTSFIKYGLSSAWFFALPLETVFGIRGRGGYLQETEDKVPIYERYYLGGINSLRGLRSVGPVDPTTGDVIGGVTMLNFNAEFLFPLVKEAGMKGLIFYDTGNAWESGYHIDDMRQTAGVGIRWYSPIGPLRLEWGYVLDRKGDEPASRWEFTIGMFM
jgi:outer membrane protein insertion porin family